MRQSRESFFRAEGKAGAKQASQKNLGGGPWERQRLEKILCYYIGRRIDSAQVRTSKKAKKPSTKGAFLWGETYLHPRRLLGEIELTKKRKLSVVKKGGFELLVLS